MSNEESLTRLVGKHYSPLVIRKYTRWGWPIYVALITDDDLSDLDSFVWDFMEENKDEGWVNNIQKVRNLAGAMVEALTEHYGKVEGVGVILYLDKTFISSLYGDFMIHNACRVELYGLLTMSIGV